MLYYRFRSPSEISIKELLYDEIYFASTDECNDPFDSKTYYEFECDIEKWTKLLNLAVSDLSGLKPNVVEEVAKSISGLCPITFEDALSADFSPIFFEAMKCQDICLAKDAANRVNGILGLYKPSTNYFVSFSKVNDEPLMWSHYAARHEGFCLIFRSEGGALNQNPINAKTTIRRSTPAGLAPSMAHGIPEKFHFLDVSYHLNAKPLCAFNRFPASVAGEPTSDKERIQIASDQENQYRHKHISWRYEEESRLTLKPPIPWLFGAHFDYSPQERLFHFEPTQLVGIIFGARMSQKNKDRIYEILVERQERISRSVDYRRVIFDFLIFESMLSTNQREIEIIPHRILQLSQCIDTTDSKFEQRYKEWSESWGLELDGNKDSRVQVTN